MSKELPEDVIVDILSRVPTRYILRFKSVSKSWYALFQNPNFISKHFQNLSATSDPSFLIVTPNIPDISTSTSTSDRTIGFILSDSSYKSIRIPIEIDASKPSAVWGSCNGLICLSVLPLASIILLWNPATRAFKDLPISPVDRPPQAVPLKVVLGFGFDDVVKDYKVLRIVHFGDKRHQVEMFSSSTNSWREIKARVSFLMSEHSLFLNGKFHWKAMMFADYTWMIACLDIHEEVFNYIMPPKFEFSESIEERLNVCFKVVAMKESLAVISCIGNGPQWLWNGSHGLGNGSGMKFEVWVMKEYGVVSSWTKYRSFELQTTIIKSLGCGLKGEFLLETDNNQLVVYDSDTQRVKNMGNHGVVDLFTMFNHVGSLISIDGGKVATRTNISSVVPDTYFVR